MTRFPTFTSVKSIPALAALALSAGVLAPLWGAEDDLRIVPQVMVGTAGFEPGMAIEWRAGEMEHVIFRPEAFISEGK